MEKYEIVVTVAGRTNSGKSTILYHLKEYLKKNGFNVKFDGGVDFNDEHLFDSQQCMKNIELAKTILEDTTIIFEEKQMNSGVKKEK